jgi:hypothetical protein
MIEMTRPRRAARWLLSAAFAACALGSAVATAADHTGTLWRDVQSRTLPTDAPQVARFRALSLDVVGMNAELAAIRANGAAITLALPRPDGGFSEFTLIDSRTMPQDLAERYPGIISLAGSDGAGRNVRVDSSPRGFQAMVFDLDGVWIVRPETLGGGDRYLSFHRADLTVPGQAFQCGVHGDALDASGKSLLGTPKPMTLTGATMRNYRAAVAANHNYVAAVGGGTVEGGLAAVVQAMNRVNQVYETELAVHMTLIANNDTIIYPTVAGDPYSNGTGALNQNQTNLDSVIGTANYDIGHVFTTGSGGVAGLRVTCVNGQKARGTTGMGNPTGDGFYIDYVAHEIGHQFGGNHTFNSQTSSCGGGNREGPAAYEPGSGSTIMAYAGICASDDLQPHSDPYFHAKSLAEIDSWIDGTGGNCTVETPNPDAAPVIDTASLATNLTIPARTPFALTGNATDGDADVLSYNWEQYDLGSATTLGQGDIGNGPIFRSFNATIDSTRHFPRLSTILGGPPAKGEALPTTTRDLNFRLTVRDNLAIGGRTQSADIVLHVNNGAGPFQVTQPNTAVSWASGDLQTVSWDVANTSNAPVNCAAVDIDLSSDGGQSFDQALASAAPNNGSAQITVPVLASTTQARVRVSCASNVFLDISDVNFSIVGGSGAPHVDVTPGSLAFEVEFGGSASDSLELSNTGTSGTTLNYTIAVSADSCTTPTPAAWLTTGSSNGAIIAGASEPVPVDVGADGLAAGVHAAKLCIASNDPAQTILEVPVSLTVAEAIVDVIFANGFDGEGGGACEPLQLFEDTSFEATTAEGGPNTFWASDSTTGDSVFWSSGGVRTGTFAVWLGGYGGGAPETMHAEQAVVFTGSNRYLNFWRQNARQGEGASDVTFLVDGVVVHADSTLALPAELDFVSQSIDLSAYADGQSHTVRIQYDHDGTGEDANYFLDDATLDCEAAPAGLRDPQLAPRMNAQKQR